MGWSDLPSELVITIAGNLTEFTDHLRFRAVCSNWRSSFHSLRRLPQHQHQQLPWLALPSTSSTQFYSLSEDRVYANPPPSVADNSDLFGSASGWFLSVTGRNGNSDMSFSLINPFTGASIGLFSPNQCSIFFYEEDALVWDRSDSVVVVGFNTRSGLFYCRLGEAWVESQLDSTANSITFYQGRFYVLQDYSCKTVVLDGETLEEITVIHAPDLGYPVVDGHLCISSSSGELFHLVKPATLIGRRRSLFSPDRDSSQFYKVRRASLNDELVEWVEVNDIGDSALFVDDIRCFLVKVVGDNIASILRRNCIYSTQSKVSDDGWRTYSISIFDLGNRSEECLDGALTTFPAVSVTVANSWPSWLLPSLN